MGQEECEVCGKRVYLMERLSVENHIFHRTCFKCHTCSTQLKPGSYEFDQNTDQFYCRSHYRELLRQRTVKRTMEQRGLTSPEGEREEALQGPKRKKKVSDSGSDEGGEDDALKIAVPRTIVKGGSKGAVGDDTKSEENEATPTQAVLATPTDVSRQESAKIRSGLPTLLKSLAAAKQKTEQNGITSSPSPSPSPTSPSSPAKKEGDEQKREVVLSRPSQLGDGAPAATSEAQNSKSSEVGARSGRTGDIAALPTKPLPPVTSAHLATGKTGSVGVKVQVPVTVSPEQKLPGKQLSGQQVQVTVDREKEKKLEAEREKREREAREREARERERERERKEQEAKREKERERKEQEAKREKERERREQEVKREKEKREQESKKERERERKEHEVKRERERKEQEAKRQKERERKEQEARREKERRDQEVKRERERERREQEAKRERERKEQEAKEREREREEKERERQRKAAESDNKESVPIKPPRRRTRKAQAVATPTESETAPEKVHEAGGQLAIFSCYLFLIFAVVLYSLSFGAYKLYVTLWQN